MDAQICNQLFESHQDGIEYWESESKLDFWPEHMWAYCPDDQVYDLDLAPDSASSPYLGLPSPILDVISLHMADSLGQQQNIDNQELQPACDNITNHVTPVRPLEDEDPATGITVTPISTPASSSPYPFKVAKINLKAKESKSSNQQRLNSRSQLPISTRHSLTEKKYRNTLNSKIDSLRASIPYLNDAVKKKEEDNDDDMDIDLGDGRKVTRCCKGVVLDEALKYIDDLEKKTMKLTEQSLKLRSILDTKMSEALLNGQTLRSQPIS